MEITKQYTLITGATGGLGVAFCHACARRGEHLLLTGRREEKLQDLRRLLTEKYPEIEIEIYAANLAEKQGRYALKSQIIKDGKTIFRLINVAGADIQKAFCKYDEEKINFQIGKRCYKLQCTFWCKNKNFLCFIIYDEINSFDNLIVQVIVRNKGRHHSSVF